MVLIGAKVEKIIEVNKYLFSYIRSILNEPNVTKPTLQRKNRYFFRSKEKIQQDFTTFVNIHVQVDTDGQHVAGN